MTGTKPWGPAIRAFRHRRFSVVTLKARALAAGDNRLSAGTLHRQPGPPARPFSLCHASITACSFFAPGEGDSRFFRRSVSCSIAENSRQKLIGFYARAREGLLGHEAGSGDRIFKEWISTYSDMLSPLAGSRPRPPF